LGAFWFFLPAGVANMAPVLANKIPLLNHWNTPLDFGLTWHQKRLLGANKTWRGVLFGTLLAGATGLVVYTFIFGDGNAFAVFWFTAVMGFGALLGDALGSFLKRRLNIVPGRSWFPFDQLDYIIGGLLFIYPFTHLPISIILTIVLLYFGLHLLISYVGYLLGLKPKPI
jgi:CDP-2,3-bis-(O-geranylgeranyl)-sn-glycerol synthase